MRNPSGDERREFFKDLLLIQTTKPPPQRKVAGLPPNILLLKQYMIRRHMCLVRIELEEACDFFMLLKNTLEHLVLLFLLSDLLMFVEFKSGK